MPIWLPSDPTSRTSRARIRSLIRGSLLLLGVAAIWDQSSCLALVLPDADRAKEKAGVGKPTPASGEVEIDPAHVELLRGRVEAIQL